MSNKKKNTFTAVDLLATKGNRVHEFLENGRLIKKNFPDNQTQVEITMDTALKLAGNDGFLVRDPDGNEIKADTGVTVGSGPKLDIDECIARFDELTRDALLERAKEAGGQFNTKSTKGDVIEFLIEATHGEEALKEYAESEILDDDDYEDDDELEESEEL